MGKKLLLLLPQTPFDPTSGAPRSMLSICRLLAGAGYEVRSLCTTAFDAPQADAPQWHSAQGLSLRMTRPPGCTRPAWSFTADGIAHQLLDTPGHVTDSWADTLGRDFEAAFAALHGDFRPDIVLTYGGAPCMKTCRRKARDAGAAVVLGLRNHGYFNKGAMVDADYGLAPSQWMARQYADFFGRHIDGLPPPLVERDIVPDSHEAVFFSFVNPSPRKGMMFFIRLAEALSISRPDIPLLVLDAHGHGALMVQAAARHGIDLRRHENIMLAPSVARPKDLLGLTRAVLVPSLWDEPFGRVAAEAQLCGIPALVSDRGGLPEAVGAAGTVLPISRQYGPESTALPPVEAVQPWIDAIVRMCDDEAHYGRLCTQAAQAGQRHSEAVLTRRYVDYFDSLRSGGRAG